MTTTNPTASPEATYVSIPMRFDFEALAPAVSKAVANLHQAAVEELTAAGVAAPLIELVRIRASQLNGCAYCVDTHSRDARSVGVSAQRVDAVAIWPDAPLFTEAERAALALADSVTRLSETHVPDSGVADALTVLGERQTAALLGLIISITAWNEIGVTSRCWPVAARED